MVWSSPGVNPKPRFGLILYSTDRRIYSGGFTEFTREVISALGYLPLWGSSKFYLRVRSLPGITLIPVGGSFPSAAGALRNNQLSPVTQTSSVSFCCEQSMPHNIPIYRRRISSTTHHS